MYKTFVTQLCLVHLYTDLCDIGVLDLYGNLRDIRS